MGQVITRLDGERITYWAMRDGIHRLYKLAKIEAPPLPWHCLRHTFCTRLAEAGVALHVIRELAGHRSIETTLRYTHTNAEWKRDAVRTAFGRQLGDKPLSAHKKSREPV
jgi:site-specific recombinase XerD